MPIDTYDAMDSDDDEDLQRAIAMSRTNFDLLKF